MSQVVVTKDELSQKRELSRQQESKIAKEDLYQRWRISSANQDKPLFALATLAFLPVIALWFLLLGLISITMTGFIVLLKGFSKIFSRADA